MKQRSTSWQKVSPWYNKITQDKGHYYHEHVIIPRVIKLLSLTSTDSLIDLACGSGVLGRKVKKDIHYLGLDIAPSLIDAAKRQDKSDNHTYVVADVARPLASFNKNATLFTHAACILAIQNIKEPEKVFEQARDTMAPKGKFIIVMNHPAFRIPRHSSWGIDEQSKLQYRRVNRYMSPLEIPMNIHPGKGRSSPLTWSYHYPLSSYTMWLKKTGFVITDIEEWTSDKESTGKKGKMENLARNEIPLFLTIVAKKA